MTQQGNPVVTNFNIDLSYTIDWSTVAAALATKPVFLFQNDNGFSHVLTDGSYSWVMPDNSRQRHELSIELLPHGFDIRE